MRAHVTGPEADVIRLGEVIVKLGSWFLQNALVFSKRKEQNRTEALPTSTKNYFLGSTDDLTAGSNDGEVAAARSSDMRLRARVEMASRLRVSVSIAEGRKNRRCSAWRMRAGAFSAISLALPKNTSLGSRRTPASFHTARLHKSPR